jgi:hypothetical protein
VCRLELVDLAGSERAAITGSQGITRKECIQINQSLFVLRKVINSLVSKQLRKNKKKTIFIPYRDSKLTSLLKQSIGGNAYCLMVTTFFTHFVIYKDCMSFACGFPRSGEHINTELCDKGDLYLKQTCCQWRPKNTGHKRAKSISLSLIANTYRKKLTTSRASLSKPIIILTF